MKVVQVPNCGQSARLVAEILGILGGGSDPGVNGGPGGAGG